MIPIKSNDKFYFCNKCMTRNNLVFTSVFFDGRPYNVTTCKNCQISYEKEGGQLKRLYLRSEITNPIHINYDNTDQVTQPPTGKNLTKPKVVTASNGTGWVVLIFIALIFIIATLIYFSDKRAEERRQIANTINQHHIRPPLKPAKSIGKTYELGGLTMKGVKYLKSVNGTLEPIKLNELTSDIAYQWKPTLENLANVFVTIDGLRGTLDVISKGGEKLTYNLSKVGNSYTASTSDFQYLVKIKDDGEFELAVANFKTQNGILINNKPIKLEIE